MSFWDRFFKFLEDRLPTILLSFFAGFKLGSRKTQELERKVDGLEVEKKLLENEKSVRDSHAGMSSESIVRDAIRQGRGEPPET